MVTLEQLRRNSFGAPYRDRAWDGLDLVDKLVQSYLCHPDWDADTHRLYLVTEEPFDPAVVFAEPVEAYLAKWRAQGRPTRFI